MEIQDLLIWCASGIILLVLWLGHKSGLDKKTKT